MMMMMMMQISQTWYKTLQPGSEIRRSSCWNGLLLNDLESLNIGSDHVI